MLKVSYLVVLLVAPTAILYLYLSWTNLGAQQRSYGQPIYQLESRQNDGSSNTKKSDPNNDHKNSINESENNKYVRILDDPFLPFNLSIRADLMPQNCIPKAKIVFVKTRKTASTTLQNILFRYGYHAGLNIVLPNQGHNLIRDKVFAVPWNSAVLNGSGYDIWAAHTQSWEPDLMRELMGDAPVIHTTILRDPSSVFESGYSYFRLQKGAGKGLHYFVKKLNDGNITDMGWISKNGLFGLNFMFLKDFGLPKQQLRNKTRIEVNIEELDNFFDLVMVSEMMEESLVLLADLMCLPLHHFVAIQKNSRMKNHKNNLSEQEKVILRRFQQADEMLYQHFRDKLNERIDDFGRERMQNSVKELNRLSKEITSACILGLQDNRNTEGTRYHEVFNDIVVYKVREDIKECKLMGYSEIGFFEMLRQHEKQRLWKRAWNSNHNNNRI